MVNNKKRLIVVCILVITILSSCTNIDKQTSIVPEYNITKGENYTYFAHERNGRVNCETLSTEYVNYYFELDKYTEEQINDFIDKVETLLKYIEIECKTKLDESISVYISEKNIFIIEDGKLFLNSINIESLDVTTALLQTIFGDSSNYGLCYGMAWYIVEKLYDSSVEPSISLNELKQNYSSSKNFELIDLTIPVFQTIFFTEEQNQYAYATSYYFVKDLIERKGLDYTVSLLKSSSELELDFDIEYAKEINIWLESIAATQRCETPLIPMRYIMSTESTAKTYPYIIYTPLTKARFIPNLEVKSEGVIMNYAYIKHYMTMYEQDVAALREYLSPYFDTEKDAIDCYFGGKQKYSYYSPKDNTTNDKITYVAPLYAGIHEYTHYLSYINSLPLWISEGLATYCSLFLVNKDVYRMMDECHILIGTRNLDSIKYYTSDINKLFKAEDKAYIEIKAKYDAFLDSKRDKDITKTVLNLHPERRDEDGTDLSQYEAASLVNYLIKTYGEEKFFDVYKEYSDSKLESTYGKAFNELRKEWLIALNNSIELNYFLVSNEYKISFTDTSEVYLPSKRSFADILDGNTFEYADCGLARNKDDESDPDANDFEGIDLKGKIALIQRGTPGEHFFYKQVNNAAKAGAVGVIVYNNQDGYVAMSLKGVEQDVPAIAIQAEDGEFLKNAKDKRVTISKDFIGIIDN